MTVPPSRGRLLCNLLIFYAAFGIRRYFVPQALVEACSTITNNEQTDKFILEPSDETATSLDFRFYFKHHGKFFSAPLLDCVGSKEKIAAFQKSNWGLLLNGWNEPRKTLYLLFELYHTTMREIFEDHMQNQTKVSESHFFRYSSMPFYKTRDLLFILLKQNQQQEVETEQHQSQPLDLFNASDITTAIAPSLLVQIRPFNTLSSIRLSSLLILMFSFLSQGLLLYRNGALFLHNLALVISDEGFHQSMRDQLLFMAGRLEQSDGGYDDELQLIWWSRVLYALGEFVRLNSSPKPPCPILGGLFKTIMTTVAGRQPQQHDNNNNNNKTQQVPPFATLVDACATLGNTRIRSPQGMCAFLEALSALLHNTETLPHEERQHLHVFDRSCKALFNGERFHRMIYDHAMFCSNLKTTTHSSTSIATNQNREFVPPFNYIQDRNSLLCFFGARYLEIVYFLSAGIVKKLEPYDSNTSNKLYVGPIERMKHFPHVFADLKFAVDQIVVITKLCLVGPFKETANSGQVVLESSPLRIVSQRVFQILGTLMKVDFTLEHPEKEQIQNIMKVYENDAEGFDNNAVESPKSYNLPAANSISFATPELAELFRFFFTIETYGFLSNSTVALSSQNRFYSSIDFLDFLLVNFIHKRQVFGQRKLSPEAFLSRINKEPSGKAKALHEAEIQFGEALKRFIPDKLLVDWIHSKRKGIFVLLLPEDDDGGDSAGWAATSFIELLKKAVSSKMVGAHTPAEVSDGNVYVTECYNLEHRFPAHVGETFVRHTIHPKFRLILPLSRMLTGLDLSNPDDRYFLQNEYAKEQEARKQQQSDKNEDEVIITADPLVKRFVDRVNTRIKNDINTVNTKLAKQFLNQAFFDGFLIFAIQHHCVVHPFFQLHKNTGPLRDEDMEILRSLPEHFFAIINFLLDYSSRHQQKEEDHEKEAEEKYSSLFASLLNPFIHILFDDLISNSAISNAGSGSLHHSELAKPHLQPLFVETNRLHLFFKTLVRILKFGAKTRRSAIFIDKTVLSDFFKKLGYYKSETSLRYFSLKDSNFKRENNSGGAADDKTTRNMEEDGLRKQISESLLLIDEIKKLLSVIVDGQQEEMSAVAERRREQIQLQIDYSLVGSFGYESRKRHGAYSLFFKKEI